jgi:hypothetical protein
MSESSGNAVAAPATVAAVMRGSSVTKLVSHGMWSIWTRLAIGHERDAWMARAEGLKSGAPDAYVPGFQSALVITSLATFLGSPTARP